MKISDQAVVAALGGYDEVPTYGTPAGKRDAMRAALVAALPYIECSCPHISEVNDYCPQHGRDS